LSEVFDDFKVSQDLGVYDAMALCKAMILVGALLLVPTLQHRIKRVNDLTPHRLEEVIKHAGDGDMKKTMTQMVEQDREELAEALVEEDVHKAQIGKVEEDAAGEAVSTLGDAFAGPGLPQDPSAEPYAAFSDAAGKDAVDEAHIRRGKEQQGKVRRGSREDKAKGKEDDKGKGKGKGKGKDAVKGKGNNAVKDQPKDAGDDKQNQLVKGRGNGQTKGTLVFKSSQRPKRTFQFMFRFPVWGGEGWISRLAFLRGPFVGFIYQEVAATKTLLIKSWKALEEFGDEAVIPQSCNYVGAKVGDKITFDVKEFAQEGEGKPRPMAKNVVIRERGHAVGEFFTVRH